ncbi:BTAD domain-containing putative transcriptional regulator [Catellatospora bangladeshensis]|uniref:SARP family transcriptional regulator n=1 Tax=Catellatospora bangladeshensis TaxID=310355 RepID=A0A8J3JG98_9ACTN|nr:BTAD domain-containing putative transcriptional regulator [Catellatospora bangladeshensis]GIF84347.1 SARP family transcriptional regulator [Catellatospora bangladeshensis]
MDVRVLGPVTVHAGGNAIDLGPRKRRYLLALLALEVNHVVPVDRLVDLMWPDGPPRTAVHAVRVAASTLRLALREVAAVEAAGGGYVLRADPLTVDAHRFRQLVTRARAEADDRVRLALLDEALALWRGPALAGVVPGTVRQRLCHGLEESRLAAAEDRLDTLLRLGHHDELVAELTAQVAAHPLRERLAGQLMTALYRCGRITDALDAYARTRARLAAELGLDPGPELAVLHRRILSRDPGLEVRAERPALPAPPPPSVVPALLPRAVSGFVGREADLARLDQLLDPPDGAPAATVAVIGGAAGVGKTSLALHWAHRTAHRFPDGQLHADLRGFGADGPLPVQDVVRSFLEALGTPAQRLPEGAAAQAGLLRSLLAGRRVLLVLDNAADEEQVRPLLPGTPGCLAVVTSRHQLPGLVVEGAQPVTLDLLTEAESRRLLARRLGAERVAAQPAAVSALVAACARLPLALAVVAARAASNPRLSLSALAGELIRVLPPERGGLDAFGLGAAPADVRAVFSWSYQAVSAPAQRLFRLLGVHPGPVAGDAAAASAAGLTVVQARRLLRELTAAHLLTEAAPGRYTSHDLLRTYAAELALDDPERDAARRRMLDHYLHSAAAAAGLLDTFRDPVPLDAPAAGVHPERPADADAALAWCTAEYPVLLAAVQAAARTGADAHAWRLACTLSEVFERLGRWDDWQVTHEAGLAAARRLGAPAAQGHCLVGLGRAAMWLRSWDLAHDRFARALALFEGLGDRDGLARTHHNLGYLHEQQGGDLRLALHHSERARELFRGGDVAGLARALNAVGWYQTLLGRHRAAIAHCEEAIALLRGLGDRRSEALTWDSIACAYQGLGEHRRAIECCHRALELLGPLHDAFHEADISEHLGDSYLAVGDPDAADAAWRRALDNLVALNHARAGELRVKLARRSAPALAGPGSRR